VPTARCQHRLELADRLAAKGSLVDMRPDDLAAQMVRAAPNGSDHTPYW
jgi:hypothetical protein